MLKPKFFDIGVHSFHFPEKNILQILEKNLHLPIQKTA